jgi:diphthine methyl ester synthase
MTSQEGAQFSRKMLYIIGLGLGNDQDITLKGLQAIHKCDKVYMEAYTSLLSFGLSSNGLSNLEKLYGKSITLADREMVEEKVDVILSQAHLSHVAFLVVGDPFGYVCYYFSYPASTF